MMPKFALALLALWAQAVSAYVNPIECTSGICNNAHDPALIRRDDGTYFRFSTGGSSSGAIPIHTAKAINGPWTAAGTVLPKGSIINRYNGAKKFDLWAPDVSKIGDTYYLYYSMSQAFGVNNSTIGVATSKTLETGSWKDLGESGVSSTAGKSNYNAIDGNIVYDGRDYYMSFGSFWSDLYMVKMANPPAKVASGVTSKQIAFIPSGTHSQEASYVYKYGSYYYLFFSTGQCCDYVNKPAPKGTEYKIQACRSSAVGGPYTDQSGRSCTNGGGTTVLESHGWVYGPGGQGVYSDPSLGPILYYHYVDTRIGYGDGQKKIGVNKLSFSSGWPVVV